MNPSSDEPTGIDRRILIPTAQFLELIHGPEAIIYFHVNDKTWKDKPQTYAHAEKTLKWRNEEGDDIYYIVNTGGSSDKSITRINGCFGDLDSGRDDHGQYFPHDIVAQKKQVFLQRIHDFSLPTSLLVETRNGFHPYWLITGDCTVDQFIDLQKRIAHYFEGDPKVCNPARVMRLPGYRWFKSKSGLPPFDVQVIEHHEVRYTACDLLEALPPCPVETAFCRASTKKPSPRAIGDHNNSTVSSNVVFIEGTNPDPKDHLSGPKDPIKLSTMDQVIEYIKNRDLLQYLNLSACSQGSNGHYSINCPLHEDNCASASVYQNPDNGHWVFKCFSSNCGVEGSIIDVVMYREMIGAGEAIQHLMKHFQIELDQTWKERQKKILEGNRAFLVKLDQYRDVYPFLFRFIERIRNDLLVKLSIALQCLESQAFPFQETFIFFCSLKHFEKKRKINYDPRYPCHQNQKVDRYAVLGLIRKVPDEEIPKVFLRNSIERKSKGRHQYRVQYYSIPEYTPEVLTEADRWAKALEDAHVTRQGISRDVILELFGKEKAREVYPQCEGELSEKSQEFMRAVEELLLSDMSSQGYSRVSILHRRLVEKHDWSQVTDRRIRKCLPILMKKWNYVEVTANQAMKERYGITDKGYPKIILSANQVAVVFPLYRDQKEKAG